MKNMISRNLQTLRRLNHLTQEEVAEKIDVSRQTVAKWESGDSLPDINKCMALAELYNVSLSHLAGEEDTGNIPIPPRGKHTFGTVTMGERGQIVIPKKAREIFGFNPGDSLIVLGDENQGGLGIMKADYFMGIVSGFLEKNNG